VQRRRLSRRNLAADGDKVFWAASFVLGGTARGHRHLRRERGCGASVKIAPRLCMCENHDYAFDASSTPVKTLAITAVTRD
jgi:hypothetical protein